MAIANCNSLECAGLPTLFTTAELPLDQAGSFRFSSPVNVMKSEGKPSHSKARRGMTLIELLVVVAILLFAAVIFVPRLQPLMDHSKLREASRVIQLYLSTARNTAMATGRSCGVMIEPLAAEPGCSMLLTQVETPTPYGGDSNYSTLMTLSGTANSGVQYPTDPATLSWPYRIAVIKFDSWPSVPIYQGDQIQIGYQGFSYGVAPATSPELPGITNGFNAKLNTITNSVVQPTTISTPNGLVPYCLFVYLDVSHGENPLIATSGVSASYKIRRWPTKSAAKALQLPSATVIDFTASGYDPSAGSSETANQVANSPLIAPTWLTPQMPTFPTTSPPTIMFAPDGTVDRTYVPQPNMNAPIDPTTGNHPVVYQAAIPTTPTYLLVGLRNKVNPPVAANANINDFNSLWISIDPATGLILISDPAALPAGNSRRPSFPLRCQRRWTTGIAAGLPGSRLRTGEGNRMRSFQFSVFSFQGRRVGQASPASAGPPSSAHGGPALATRSCPTLRYSARRRAGLSLIEVLASIGVISVGLLGLASLLPVGLVTIFQATKADRAGNCGRLAMRELVVRRMLDNQHWYDVAQGKYVYNPNYKTNQQPNQPWCAPPAFGIPGPPTQYMPASFLIDPLGVNNGMTLSFGSGATNTPRISLDYIPTGSTSALANAIFRATDDIIATAPENMKPAQPPGRPIPVMNTGVTPNAIASKGDYSWFATVTPSPSIPFRFTVSVVVCYARTLGPPGGPIAETAIPVTTFWDTVPLATGGTVAMAGGSVQLNVPMANGTLGGIPVHENDWVALVRGVGPNPATPQSPAAGYVQWYRVAAIGDSSDNATAGAQLTLAGPDWMSPMPVSVAGSPAKADQLVVLGQQVVGVYTTTIDLDTDLTLKN